MSSRRLIGLLVCAMLALAPALVEARAGGGMSSGSRGGRTYHSAPATPTAPQSRPVERSMTSPTQPQRPATTPYPAQARPSFFQRNPFVSGLLGGLVGAGIAGLLFGHGFFGAGLGGAGLLGLLLQLAIIGGIVWFVMRALRRRNEPDAARPAFAYAHRTPMPDVAPIDIGTGHTGATSASASSDEIGIGEAEFHEFERLLREVQAGWSRGDLAALRRLATPEMVSYFSEELSAQASAGVENKIESVKLQQGDLAEAWREGSTDYATVAMRWSAIDYTVNTDTGALVDGSKTEHVEATEIWTFMRTAGGRWLLSAIQQV